MLNRILVRLGTIFAMAVVVFTIGKMVNIISPPDETGPPARIAHTVLAAPLSDPVMQSALDDLQGSGSFGNSNSGEAQLTFQSLGGPVTLSPSDIEELNARYYELSQRPESVPWQGNEEADYQMGEEFADTEWVREEEFVDNDWVRDDY